MQTPSYKQILAMAAPIILANCSTPMLGLADTAIIGNFASTQHLGAIALGALILSFVYWGFGFLRMSTTGFVAQAMGKSDPTTAALVLLRALLLALLIGLGLIALQKPVIQLSLWLLGASAEVEKLANDYFVVRIWGAPATLATYALMGYLIGSGQNRTLLVIQLVLNGLNIGFDFFFAGYLGWGAAGIATGTLLAEWITVMGSGLFILRQITTSIGNQNEKLYWKRILDLSQILITLQENSNLLIRTLFLLLGFALFTNQGARFGDSILAANHLLLQLISFSAFFLDGYAHVSEFYIGRAMGSRNWPQFKILVQRTTYLAAFTALILAATIAAFRLPIVEMLTDIPQVRAHTLEYMPYALAYIVVSFAAFQLDGIYIGATYSSALRNASLIATISFILASLPLVALWHNQGLWCAFIFFVIFRAVTLGYYSPQLKKQVERGSLL